LTQSIFDSAKPAKAAERNFGYRITLLRGPNLRDITVDARLCFGGISGEEFFELVIEIEKVFKAEEVAGTFGTNAGNIVGDVYFSGVVLRRSIQPTGGKAGVWNGYLPIQVRGLWRKSGGRITEILPNGNGFVDLFE
jgi:hypothetical protein